MRRGYDYRFELRVRDTHAGRNEQPRRFRSLEEAKASAGPYIAARPEFQAYTMEVRDLHRTPQRDTDPDLSIVWQYP